MAISFVGSNTNFTTAGTHPLTATIPTGTQNGDILVATYTWGAADQTVTMPSGWSVLVDRQVLGSAVGTFAVVYRTMATGVTGVSFNLPSANVAKAVITIAAYRGCVVDALGSVGNRASTSVNIVAPAITTLQNGDWVVGAFGDRVSSQTGATAPTGMTERAKYITGLGGGVSGMIADVTQAAAGTSGTKTAVYDVASAAGAGALLSLKAVANFAPTVNAGADQTVAVSTLTTLTRTATDSDGTVASTAWTQTAGPAITLSAPSAASTTFTPTVAGIYTFQCQVTDNGGATGTDSVTIYVTSTTGLPVTTISNPGGYTNVGGAATVEAAVADSSDSTYLQSPDAPAGAAVTLRLNPLAPGQVTVTVRAQCSSASPPMEMDVALMQGGTVIGSWTDTVTTSYANYSHTTTELQAANISNFNDLRVRVTATES